MTTISTISPVADFIRREEETSRHNASIAAGYVADYVAAMRRCDGVGAANAKRAAVETFGLCGGATFVRAAAIATQAVAEKALRARADAEHAHILAVYGR